MHCYICETCGTQHASMPEPPSHCSICDDDRQYVGWNGQTWTTHAALGKRYQLRIEDDDGLLGIGIRGEFAIPQRAVVLPTSDGIVLWECVSLVTDQAIAAIKAGGGLNRIVISHPHFYSSMVEWSDAFGGVPILLHEADRDWVRRSSRNVHFWSGDVHRLSKDVTLIRCGGHFPGSTALLWHAAGRRPVLFPGDALQVATDRRHVAFMYSYPNYVPMKTSDVRAMRERLAGYEYEDVYGYTWGRNIIGNGRAAVEASFDRHLQMVNS
jgi:glyoxylase-like metal-dependent hydrolase (beta-lactamase superfamily II)